jgi:hypothetical protein
VTTATMFSVTKCILEGTFYLMALEKNNNKAAKRKLNDITINFNFESTLALNSPGFMFIFWIYNLWDYMVRTKKLADSYFIIKYYFHWILSSRYLICPAPKWFHCRVRSSKHWLSDST